MKIFCVEVVDGEPQFYVKSETAQIRNNEPLYIPFFCEELRYEFAFAIKINRVTKAIDKKFAARCWNEYSIVTNFWSEDMALKQRVLGAPQDIAYTFDRSFALANDFHMKDHIKEEGDTILASTYVNGVEVESLIWSDICGEIDNIISYLSIYVTLKIGDVIMIRSSKKNWKAAIGDRIEVKFGEEIVVETIIK